MYHIRIRLPKDRTRHGVLILGLDPRIKGDPRVAPGGGLALLPSILCYGKADNARAAEAGNPGRDPTRPYGDTPAGVFARTRVERFATPHPRLGRAWIPLAPVAGQPGQAAAALANGREGLGIHAGRGDGELMPTYGCVRLGDRDFAVLARRIGDGAVEVTIEEVE